MKPDTLQIINKIWQYREETKTPVCFTLDAGANVHMLYPSSVREKVLAFAREELAVHCENGQYINDQVGEGAIKINDQRWTVNLFFYVICQGFRPLGVGFEDEIELFI